jgi:hypothetical protein
VCGIDRAVSAMMNARARQSWTFPDTGPRLCAWPGRAGRQRCSHSPGPRVSAERRWCGVGLVNDHQHPAVLLQAGEKFAQRGFVLRQRLVEDPLSRPRSTRRRDAGLADTTPAVNLVSFVHSSLLAPLMVAVTTPDAGTDVTKRPEPEEGAGRVPISSQRVSPNPAATPPDHQ